MEEERTTNILIPEPSELDNLIEHLNFEKHTFFWRADHPLSQWYPAEFVLNDHSFTSAEQYMMWRKAMLFEDLETADKILATDSPEEAKKLGRQVKNFQQEQWDAACKQIVYEGNYAKFSQNPELLEQLLATVGTLIVETNPRDRIWGIGMFEREAKQTPPEQWRGQNLLGKILTVLRDLFITRKS